MLETIKSNKEISKVFNFGKRYSNRYVTFIVMQFQKTFSINTSLNMHDLSGRVAFIAGKKYGNSVWRNSAKRRLREIYRANKSLFNNFDILLIAKSSILNDSYFQVLDSCKYTLIKINNDQS